MEPNETCPFCAIAAEGRYLKAYAYTNGWPTVVRFEPLNPVVEGHMLFIPTRHAEHPDESAVGHAMLYAAQYGEDRGEAFNLITSSGAAATQTVPHVHVHYVPRREGDGLHLPWTGQQK